MNHLHPFHENPFYILGASPMDDRRKLISLANDAKLLSDCDVEDALNQLLHHQRRLDAEMHWFPHTDPVQVSELLSYAENRDIVPFADFHSVSVLAQFNACLILLQKWPITNTDAAFALCHSIALMDVELQPELLMQEINQERGNAGFQVVDNIDTVTDRLGDLRRSIASKLIEQFTDCGAVDVQRLALKLARLYEKISSPLIEALISEYELRHHDSIEKLFDAMIQLAPTLPGYAVNIQLEAHVADILAQLDDWNNFTLPGRTIQQANGIERDQSKQLYHDIREAAVQLQNKNHKTELCLRMIQSLQKTFVEIADAQDQLAKDAQTLKEIMQQNSELLRQFINSMNTK